MTDIKKDQQGGKFAEPRDITKFWILVIVSIVGLILCVKGDSSGADMVIYVVFLCGLYYVLIFFVGRAENRSKTGGENEAEKK